MMGKVEKKCKTRANKVHKTCKKRAKSVKKCKKLKNVKICQKCNFFLDFHIFS